MLASPEGLTLKADMRCQGAWELRALQLKQHGRATAQFLDSRMIQIETLNSTAFVVLSSALTFSCPPAVDPGIHAFRPISSAF